MLKPNATAIFMLTKQIDQDNEMIIYINFRELTDIYPDSDNVYLFPHYGKEGKPKKIFNDIRQWFAVGGDKFIGELKSVLFKDKEFTLAAIRKSFKMIGGDFREVKNQKEWGKVKEYPLTSAIKRTSWQISEFEKGLVTSGVGAYLDQMIDMLKNEKREYAQELFPYGFISLSELEDALKNRIVLVDERRFVSETFQGYKPYDMERKEGFEPNVFHGFIQDAPLSRSEIILKMTLEESADPMTSAYFSEIDVVSGKWRIELPMRTSHGYVYLIEKVTGAVLSAEEFHLIKDIHLETNVISNSTKDFYGRTISFTKNKFPKPSRKPSDRAWYLDPYVDKKNYQWQMKISDYMSDVIASCAPEIIIIDPYFVGELKIEGKRIDATEGQKIFLNALLTAVTRVKITSLTFIAMKKRVSKYFLDAEGKLKEQYKDVFNEYHKMQDGMTFKFVFTDKIFHDRFWVGMADDPSGGSIFSINTSIAGLASSNEIRVSMVNNTADKIKLYTRMKMIIAETPAEEIAQCTSN